MLGLPANTAERGLGSTQDASKSAGQNDRHPPSISHPARAGQTAQCCRRCAPARRCTAARSHPAFPCPANRPACRAVPPRAAGRSASRRLMSSAGMWPSTTYPPISAVWQEALRTGTPRRTLIDSCHRCRAPRPGSRRPSGGRPRCHSSYSWQSCARWPPARPDRPWPGRPGSVPPVLRWRSVRRRILRRHVHRQSWSARCPAAGRGESAVH